MADNGKDDKMEENHVNGTSSPKPTAEPSPTLSSEMDNNAIASLSSGIESSEDAQNCAADSEKAICSQEDNDCQNTVLNSTSNLDSSGVTLEDKTSHLSPVVGHLSINASPDEELKESSFRQLKKDDSGIVLQASPGADKCNSDETDNSNQVEEPKESSLVAGSSSRVDRPSTSNESEGVVADFLDTEDSETVAGAQIVSASDNSESGSHQMEQDEPEVAVSSRGRFRLLNRRNLRSYDNDDDDDDDDEDDDSNDESMDHDRTKDSSSESSNGDMDIDWEIPKDTWRPLYEVHRRELGYGNRIPLSHVFSDRCGASINLVQRLQLYSKLEHHEGCVNALHFNEQGTLLASGSDDLNIVVWKWMLKKPFFSFDSGHRSNVFQSKFMPYTGDTHIVSCARDGQIRLAELSSTGTCKATKRLAQHRGAAHKLALLQDSSHVFYSCGEDGITYEIDLRQEKPNKLSTTKEENKKVPLYSIHSNPSKSHEYCVSGRDHYLRVFDKRMANEGDNSGLMKKYCPQHLQGAAHSDIKANVTCAVYNYNGQEILGTYNDEDIYLFDNTHTDGADAIHRYKGHRNNATVKGVNFYGPKSEYVITGSDCGNIFLWEKNSQKIVHFFEGDDAGVVNVLEPHPHGPILATSGLDHDIKIWMPTAFAPTKLQGLKKIVKRNTKDREEDRMDPSEAIDSSTFWRLMQHFRRTARRRARQEGEEVSTDSDSGPGSDDDGGDDDDEEGEHGEPIQCVQS